MENSASTIKNLVERIEQYSKTSIDLYKYTAIYKTAALFSFLAVKFIFTLIIFAVSLLFTIALSLLIGDELGKTAYGFLVMGLFYSLLGIIIFIFRKPWIQVKMSNSIIESFETNEKP
ncbi:hypothetical protein [Flavobacterium sp.]|uniref:hypothetical protein n=1 Tax=Flavobacterium sp. TaxID=239 RepID=UPI0025F0A0EB|nr:hypothetical protein [Flavobacterium sp.]